MSYRKFLKKTKHKEQSKVSEDTVSKSMALQLLKI